MVYTHSIKMLSFFCTKHDNMFVGFLTVMLDHHSLLQNLNFKKLHRVKNYKIRVYELNL